jgi:hypothetical protein
MQPAGQVSRDVEAPQEQTHLVAAAVAPTAADCCGTCGRPPSAAFTFYVVESFVIFFRWRRLDGRWCGDCATDVFRRSQHRCLTRGWWGLLLGPIANLIALTRNLFVLRHVARLAPPAGDSSAVREQPVRTRRSAYVATAAAAAVVALVTVVPTTGSSHHTTRLAVSSGPTTSASADDVITSPTPAPAPAAPKTYAGSLTPLMLHRPPGWRQERDLRLPVALLAKSFTNRELAKTELQALRYRGGLDREIYQPTPRVVISEEVWRFDTADDALGWFLIFGQSNHPHAGSTYKRQLMLHGDALGFLARNRDHYGFSYGVAVGVVENVVIHVRYAALPTVTTAQLSKTYATAIRAVSAGLAAARR